MQQECIMAGFGGQGIMSMGQFLAYSGMNESKQVIWLPSYGPEMRGGTAYCTVILSEKEIGSPVISNPEVAIVMNRPSLDKFAPQVKPNGLLFINSSLIDVKSERDDIEQFMIPANDIAMEMKSLRSANIAMLGAYIAKTKIVKFETVEQFIKKKFASKTAVIETNLEIFSRGYNYLDKS